MNKFKIELSFLLILFVAFEIFSFLTLEPCHARGGFRGGGFRGGGFRGGFGGYRPGVGGAYGPGMNNSRSNLWGSGHSSAGYNPVNRSYHNQFSPRGNSINRVSEAQRTASANKSYNWGSSHLPTDVGMSRAVRSPRINAHRTTPINNRTLANRGALVRRNFNHWNCFRTNFFRRYRYGWWYPGWYDYWAWGYYDYSDWCGYWDEADCEDKPVEYAYGNSIRYNGDTVYYGSKPAASASAYYEQAKKLATSVSPSSKEQPKKDAWKPMGVFSLTQGNQTNSNSIFQLASNKQGVVRGNYYNPLTDEVKPVQGKINMKNKRVAWTISGNNEIVYDTGLANLLSDQSTLLIHFGKDQTQQWDLIRLKNEKAKESNVSGKKKSQ